MPNNNNNQSNHHVQLRQLKKAIQAAVHRTTGQQPPLLADNVAFQNYITYGALSPEDAWYIVPNTIATSKIHQLYSRSTLNTILSSSNPSQRRSPVSHQPITAANLRKYMNFAAPPAQNVINLTGNTTHAAPTVRPRHGLISSPTIRSSLRQLMLAVPGSVATYKIWIQYNNGAQRMHFKMKKVSNGQFEFFSMDGSLQTSATTTTFMTKLQEFLAHYPASTLYKGYRRIG